MQFFEMITIDLRADSIRVLHKVDIFKFVREDWSYSKTMQGYFSKL